MKLEVGMYVRTKKGIFQIRNKDVFIEDKKQYIGVNGRYTCIDIETIEKASHNIIDLIEVGDYVNGYKVLGTNLNLKWYDDELGEQDETEGIELEGYGYVCPNSNYHFELKSIVTKEQFAAMQYEVK